MSLQTGNEANAAKCDLVSSVLHVFLLRMHSHTKTHRLGTTGIMRVQVQGQPPRVLPSPPLLQPVIDLLQYEVFCKRVHAEVHKVVRALDVAGIPCSIHFNSAGESGNELVRLLEDSTTQKVGGEAVLRIDERYVEFNQMPDLWLSDHFQTHYSSDIPFSVFTYCTSCPSHAATILDSTIDSTSFRRG